LKKIIFVLLLASTLLLTGCLPKKQTSQIGQTQPPAEEKKTVFDSIRDAISKSLSLRCDYVVENNKVTVYIKGKLIRSEADTSNGKGHTILKDNKMWFWTEKDKNGFVIDLSRFPKSVPVPQKSSEDIINEVEKFKQDCKQTAIPDSMFNPPADIKFQDLSQMFENFGATVKP